MNALFDRSGPFKGRNARLFVVFTTLYNARAYYPVLAVLFTDLGLRLEQYLLLNAVWAAAIFLFEVPSGALADTLGRKRLLVFSASLMVLEMGVLLFAPKDGGMLLFALCLLNRFLSGTSEAAASGADEAIVYESLPEKNRESAWDQIMATAMRWRSAGYLLAMTLGALLYDPSWWNRLTPDALHVDIDVARRLPVLLVLLQAIGCLWITLRFEETVKPNDHVGGRCRAALTLTIRTAAYAFTTKSIAMVLIGGLLIDAVVRNFATINSEYYRLIGVPAWAFGFIGSAVAVINWFTPGIFAAVNQRFKTTTSLALGGTAAAIALILLIPAWPWAGLLPAMFLMTLLGFVGFTISRFLHAIAESHQRATLISVKGLVFNLGYGAYSLIFSLMLAGMHQRDTSGTHPFQQALLWQAAGFAAVLLIFIALSRRAR